MLFPHTIEGMVMATAIAHYSVLAPAAFAAKGHHHHHVAKHYKHAPKGWHRHNHRPIGWYGRGCVMVGPLWYCP